MVDIQCSSWFPTWLQTEFSGVVVFKTKFHDKEFFLYEFQMQILSFPREREREQGLAKFNLMGEKQEDVRINLRSNVFPYPHQ